MYEKKTDTTVDEPDPGDCSPRELAELLEVSGDHDAVARSAAAAFLGRLGGLKGGIARARKLSPERRSEIARQAVEARWAKARGEEPESA